ncbi:MAG: hypothetical protein Q9164_007907, partial [Protoblastenia rupestris]
MPLAPEELALTLATMLAFWHLSPTTHDQASNSTPADLAGLTDLLSRRKAVAESSLLIQELLRSFRNAVTDTINEDESVRILELVEEEYHVEVGSPPSKELHKYFVKRLVGN